MDPARPRLVTGGAGQGSAQGVGVSGCEPWERGARAVTGEEGEARARERGARPVGPACVSDGVSRLPTRLAVLPPGGPASPESRGGGAARGHHFLRAGDTPPGRHGGAEAAVAARGSSCTCITGAAAAALLLCGFFPC